MKEYQIIMMDGSTPPLTVRRDDALIALANTYGPKDGPEKLEAKYKTLLTPAQFKELSDELHRLRKMLESHPDNFVLDLDVIERGFIQKYYSNLLSRVENTGHRFGESLSDREKQALIAFLGTL